MLWHQRLGHPLDHYLYNAHKFVKRSPQIPTHESAVMDTCPTCIKSRSKSSPNQQETQTLVATQPRYQGLSVNFLFSGIPNLRMKELSKGLYWYQWSQRLSAGDCFRPLSPCLAWRGRTLILSKASPLVPCLHGGGTLILSKGHLSSGIGWRRLPTGGGTILPAVGGESNVHMDQCTIIIFFSRYHTTKNPGGVWWNCFLELSYQNVSILQESVIPSGVFFWVVSTFIIRPGYVRYRRDQVIGGTGYSTSKTIQFCINVQHDTVHGWKDFNVQGGKARPFLRVSCFVLVQF